MIIGVPKEIKVEEYRVGLIPSFVKDIIKDGHKVFVQENAGIGAGFSDLDYKEVGAEIVKKLEDIYKKCDLIVKGEENWFVNKPIEEGLVIYKGKLRREIVF